MIKSCPIDATKVTFRQELDQTGLKLLADLVGCPALDGPVVPGGVQAELEETGGLAHTELGGREVYELLQCHQLVSSVPGLYLLSSSAFTPGRGEEGTLSK